MVWEIQREGEREREREREGERDNEKKVLNGRVKIVAFEGKKIFSKISQKSLSNVLLILVTK